MLYGFEMMRRLPEVGGSSLMIDYLAVGVMICCCCHVASLTLWVVPLPAQVVRVLLWEGLCVDGEEDLRGWNVEICEGK